MTIGFAVLLQHKTSKFKTDNNMSFKTTLLKKENVTHFDKI